MKRLFCCNSLGQTDPVELVPQTAPSCGAAAAQGRDRWQRGVALLRKARPRARDQQARMNFVADGPN